MQNEQISLYCQDGNSDKVYHAQLIVQSDGCLVAIQYGRRGSTLQTGSKTDSPTLYEKAKKIFDKLVQDKMAKGYTTGEGGSAYQNTDTADRVSGFMPQLLNPITESDVQQYINDDRYIAQEKMDGQRRIIDKKVASEVDGINRKGLVVALSLPQAEGICNTPILYSTFTLDSESIGDTLYVFDALAVNGSDIKSRPFDERFSWAESIVTALGSKNVKIVPVAVTKAEKQALFDAVKARRGEGVVFKLKSSGYEPGRPASGGAQLKFKFVETASCLVKKANEGKRSVALSLFDDEGRRQLGMSLSLLILKSRLQVRLWMCATFTLSWGAACFNRYTSANVMTSTQMHAPQRN